MNALQTFLSLVGVLLIVAGTISILFDKDDDYEL